MRDDFLARVKDTLAKRVGLRCSNPNCRILTSGPQEDPEKSVNVGVASHITAASPGGPRYDDSLTSDDRESAENGIWLCQKCAKLIDNDVTRYSVAKLRNWKFIAEQTALNEVEGHKKQQPNPDNEKFNKIKKLMPDLLDEMRVDVTKYPLRREFILLKKEWIYNSSDGRELIYFYNEHPDLDDKIRILQNYSLVYEITFNNTKRFIMTEDFVDYLMH